MDLKKALELAQAMAHADKETGGNGNSAAGKPVHYQVKKNSRPPKSKTKPQGAGASKSCYRCGKRDHMANKCWAKNLTCHKCKRQGHVAAVCRSGQKSDNHSQVKAIGAEPEQGQCACTCQCKVHSSSVHVAASQQADKPDGDDEYSLYFHGSGTEKPIHDIDSEAEKPIIVQLTIKQIDMELDTGASKTIMCETTYNSQYGPDSLPLQPPGCVLNTYTHDKIPLLGSCGVCVQYQDQQENLPLVIVKGDGANLLGRDWLNFLNLDWSQIFRVNNVVSVRSRLEERHPALFADGLGQLRATLFL